MSSRSARRRPSARGGLSESLRWCACCDDVRGIARCLGLQKRLHEPTAVAGELPPDPRSLTSSGLPARRHHWIFSPVRVAFEGASSARLLRDPGTPAASRGGGESAPPCICDSAPVLTLRSAYWARAFSRLRCFMTKKPPMPTGRTEARERAGVSQRRRERGGGTHCRGRRGTSRWWRLRDLGQPWLLCRRREGRGREERTHGGFGAALSL